jgi:hypothetical protein
VANSWVRLWEDMPSDPKWRAIARRSSQRIGDVMAVFNFMLVAAYPHGGKLVGWSDDDVAAALDLDEADVTAIRDAMQGKVLDGDRLMGWEKRQPKREDDSSARVRRHREKKRSETPENPYVTQCNADETQCNAPDTDTDTDINKKGGACAPTEYAFAGDVIRIDQSQADQWRSSFPSINLVAELQAADAYYRENPPKGGKWFFPVANWLKRAEESKRGPPKRSAPGKISPATLAELDA